MITAGTSQAFEARVVGFPAGKTGLVGIQILDDAGDVTRERTTTGISENPADSGSYIVTLTAPADPGEYSVFWDWDGGGTIDPSHSAAEDLSVFLEIGTPAPVVSPTGPAVVAHFALPFRFVGGTAAVNEQDSDDDVADCVLAIASYPIGSRIEKPEFGIPDQAFRQAGVDAAALATAVNRWEPRATATALVDNSDLADRVSRVTVATKETP